MEEFPVRGCLRLRNLYVIFLSEKFEGPPLGGGPGSDGHVLGVFYGCFGHYGVCSNGFWWVGNVQEGCR